MSFSLVYAFSEHFTLPLSHDEVVHGKGSLLNKMPGDAWQRHANLRAYFAFMWAHPGKKLLFMGGEIGQEREWSHDRSIDWHLLNLPEHDGVRALVGVLNEVMRREPALHQRDETEDGFRWIDASDVDNNVLSFMRVGDDGTRPVVCIANLSPVVRGSYRIGLPTDGAWEELLNTDELRFGGSGVVNGSVAATDEPWQGLPHSAEFVLPPLGVCWFSPAQ
jgi:1,4-alpha-glucan branching enzyme